MLVECTSLALLDEVIRDRLTEDKDKLLNAEESRISGESCNQGLWNEEINC